MSKEEQIRSSIDHVDSEILKDTLALLLAKNDNAVSTQKNTITSNYKNFAQAILDLKKNYKFPELNAFSTEADLVYVQAGDRRILLTERNPEPIAKDSHDSESSVINKDNDSQQDSMDNAFENIKPNDSRFSHLEF